MKVDFNLSCFKPCEFCTELKVSGTLNRNQNLLDIKYNINGNLDLIEFENENLSAGRKINLWEKTCFEFFLKPIDQKKYWEFNLSTSGDWNIFKFDDYRQNMIEESGFEKPVIRVDKHKNLLSLNTTLKTEKIFSLNEKILIAVSMVLKHENHISYWSLNNSQLKPDFHHQSNFKILLNP